MNKFIDVLFRLITDASRVIDPLPTGGGFKCDRYSWHIYRRDFGENILADVTILIRPAVQGARCAIEVFSCASTVDGNSGALADSTWAVMATPEVLTEGSEALKTNLAGAIRKAWEDLPNLVKRLPKIGKSENTEITEMTEVKLSDRNLSAE